MLYPISEIFQSFQGEATYTGTPSVFIRLQGCPIQCPWCDTSSSWATPPAGGTEIRVDEMLAKTEDAPTFAKLTGHETAELIEKQYRAKLVVITGGEPCIHDIYPLCDALLARNFSVQVETSGAYGVNVPGEAWVTVSPKIGMPGSAGPRLDALYRANELKMPIGKPQDISHLLALAKNLRPGTGIWVQPLSQSEKATALCLDAATQYGWRLSLQTHKFVGAR